MTVDDGYGKTIERLITYRKTQGINQKKISRMAKITQSHYSKIENRAAIMSWDALTELEKNGINADFLITGIEYKKTELNELMEKCPDKEKANFMRVMNVLTDIAVMHGSDNASEENSETNAGNNNVRQRKETKIKTDIVKELEILEYYTTKTNSGESKDNKNSKDSKNSKESKENTVWSCIRKINGLTQEEMSEVLDIGIKRYRDIEKGKIKPDVEILARVYEKLGVIPSLIMDTGERNYLFVLNGIWENVAKDRQEKILEILRKVLEYIKRPETKGMN